MESPEKQSNPVSPESDPISHNWPRISEMELKYLDAIGGCYRGLVEGDEGKRYEDVWCDVKVVYGTSHPIAKAVVETRAYGNGILYDDSGVEGYSVSMKFEPFGDGETQAFKFDVNSQRIGVPQKYLHMLVDDIHHDIVHGINTLPRDRSLIQGEIDRDIKDWKSEMGSEPEEFAGGEDPVAFVNG